MAEQDLRLAGAEGYGIYGRLCSNGHRRLVIHIHGLTHHARHLLEVTSSEFFEENGYDHYRVSLYERLPDSRKLHQSTLSTHQSDIQTILDHFRKSYREIFISAHSLGGLVILMLNPQNVAAISLWDPSTDVTNYWATGPYLTHMPEQRQYQLDYGNVFVLSERMVEEIKLYPDEKGIDLARSIKTPMQFVIPEESISLASPRVAMEKYAEAFAGPFDLQRIPGANHVFSNRGNRQALFKATLNWFNKHSGLF